MSFIVRKLAKNIIQIGSLGRLIFKRYKTGKCLYLTFDDGPDPVYTPKVLEILANNDAKATFFVIGEKVDKYPDYARKITDEGHAIAGHTYHHKVITEMSVGEMKSDLKLTRDTIKKHTKVDSWIFRPPKGKMNVINILISLLSGYRVVHWSITYSDYKKDSLERLKKEMNDTRLSEGDILLLHDNNQFTVDALGDFIRSAKKLGYRFCPLH